MKVRRPSRKDEEDFLARLTAARQESTRIKKKALNDVLAHVLATAPLSDEARQRITGLMFGDGDET